MTKILYNACFGGFSISEQALMRYAELKGLTIYPEDKPFGRSSYTHRIYWLVPPEQRDGILADDAWHLALQEERVASNQTYSQKTINLRDFSRTDPVLIQVVEELGAAADGQVANLKIAELPEGTQYRIDEYDGYESVKTIDDYEWSTA